jgi:hypothetical protein
LREILSPIDFRSIAGQLGLERICWLSCFWVGIEETSVFFSPMILPAVMIDETIGLCGLRRSKGQAPRSSKHSLKKCRRRYIIPLPQNLARRDFQTSPQLSVSCQRKLPPVAARQPGQAALRTSLGDFFAVEVVFRYFCQMVASSVFLAALIYNRIKFYCPFIFLTKEFSKHGAILPPI